MNEQALLNCSSAKSSKQPILLLDVALILSGLKNNFLFLYLILGLSEIICVSELTFAGSRIKVISHMFCT